MPRHCWKGVSSLVKRGLPLSLLLVFLVFATSIRAQNDPRLQHSHSSTLTALPRFIVSKISENLDIRERTKLFASARELNAPDSIRLNETFSNTRSSAIANDLFDINYRCHASLDVRALVFRQLLIYKSLPEDDQYSYLTVSLDSFQDVDCYLAIFEKFALFNHIESVIINDFWPFTRYAQPETEKFELFLNVFAASLAKSNVRTLRFSPNRWASYTRDELIAFDGYTSKLLRNLIEFEVKLDEFVFEHRLESRFEERDISGPWDALLLEFIPWQTGVLSTSPSEGGSLKTMTLEFGLCPDVQTLQLDPFRRALSSPNSSLEFLALKFPYGDTLETSIHSVDQCHQFVRDGLVKSLVPPPILTAADAINSTSMMKNGTNTNNYTVYETQEQPTSNLQGILIEYPNDYTRPHYRDDIFKLYCAPSLEFIQIDVDTVTIPLALDFAKCFHLRADKRLSPIAFRPLVDLKLEVTLGGAMFKVADPFVWNLLGYNSWKHLQSGMKIMTRALLDAAKTSTKDPSTRHLGLFHKLYSFRFPILAGDIKTSMALFKTLRFTSRLMFLHIPPIHPVGRPSPDAASISYVYDLESIEAVFLEMLKTFMSTSYITKQPILRKLNDLTITKPILSKATMLQWKNFGDSLSSKQIEQLLVNYPIYNDYQMPRRLLEDLDVEMRQELQNITFEFFQGLRGFTSLQVLTTTGEFVMSTDIRRLISEIWQENGWVNYNFWDLAALKRNPNVVELLLH